MAHLIFKPFIVTCCRISTKQHCNSPFPHQPLFCSLTFKCTWSTETPSRKDHSAMLLIVFHTNWVLTIIEPVNHVHCFHKVRTIQVLAVHLNFYTWPKVCNVYCWDAQTKVFKWKQRTHYISNIQSNRYYE